MNGVGQMVAPALARGVGDGQGRPGSPLGERVSALVRRPNQPARPAWPAVRRIGKMAEGAGEQLALPPQGQRAGGAAGRGGGCGRKRNQTNPESAEILALGRDEGGRARRVPAPLAPGPCAMRLLRGWRHVRGADPRARPLCDRFLPVPPLARAVRPPSAAAGLASAGAAQRKSWMRVTRRPPRPCFSIACSQVVNSSLERL
jgi:hypothetical protein